MQFIKRHTFTLIAILIVLGIYLFSRSEEAVAPTSTSNSETTQSEAGADKILSDEELISYAQSEFDKAAMMGKEVNLGKHNGQSILVTFPCSDVCPDSTIRIIRYDIESSQCGAVGGELRSILVPIAITVVKQEFCFPKPIIDAEIYEFVESQA